jgi:hypothetical protein
VNDLSPRARAILEAVEREISTRSTPPPPPASRALRADRSLLTALDGLLPARSSRRRR